MPDLVIARTAQGDAVTGNPVVVGFDDIESQTVPGLITTGSRWTFTARNAGRYLVSLAQLTPAGVENWITIAELP